MVRGRVVAPSARRDERVLPLVRVKRPASFVKHLSPWCQQAEPSGRSPRSWPYRTCNQYGYYANVQCEGAVRVFAEETTTFH